MPYIGQIVFAIDLPPLLPHLHHQGPDQRHRRTSLGSRTHRDRLFTWTCSVALSPPPTAATATTAVDPFGLKNVPPDLTVSLRCRPTTSTPESRQSLVNNHLCHYSRLLITSLPASSPLDRHVHSATPVTLLDMPIRQAEVPLQGLQVELDCSLLPSNDQSMLHVVLSANGSNSNNSSSALPHSISTSTSRQFERKQRVWQRTGRKRTLDSRFISTEAQQRLTTVLESEIGADVQIMFAKDPFEMIWMDSIPTDEEIHAHSCILKTVNTESMRRLLNTYPPQQDRAVTRANVDRAKGDAEGVQEHPSGGKVGNDSNEDDSTSDGGRQGQSPTVGSRGQTNANTSDNTTPTTITTTITTNKDDHKSSRETINSTQLHSMREPIRAIRFEDSPPAAVRAVVRYVYLGERPAVEANCGYTVKDLMALSTFLGIEPLKDYCVALVLGLPQDCCCCESNEHRPMMCSRHSSPADWQQVSRIRTKPQLGYTEDMMMPPESMLQTLFAWGHRFPRIEQALIEVLVSDHGKIAEETVMNRFKNHQAFERILFSMMMEQVRQRSEDGQQ